MPMYEFRCDQCGSVAEHLASYAERETVRFPCARTYDTYSPEDYPEGEFVDLKVDDDGFAHCDGKQSYVGLSLCAVGRSHTFGLIMGDGRKVPGMMNGKDAPLKKRKR